MPAAVRKQGDLYRVINSDTGRLEINAAGTQVDGGGHRSQAAAARQARAINASKSRKQREQKSLHHVQIADPGRFTRLRTIDLGDGIQARVGFDRSRTDPGAGKSEVQVLLFDPDKFTFTEAKAWAREHNFKPLKEGTAAAELA